MTGKTFAAMKDDGSVLGETNKQFKEYDMSYCHRIPFVGTQEGFAAGLAREAQNGPNLLACMAEESTMPVHTVANQPIWGH